MFQYSIRTIFLATLLVSTLVALFVVSKGSFSNQNRNFTNENKPDILNGVRIPTGSVIFEVSQKIYDGSNAVISPGHRVAVLQRKSGQPIVSSVTVCYSIYGNSEFKIGMVLQPNQVKKIELAGTNNLRLLLLGN